MNNFNFVYVTRPNIGEVTDIDTKNNCITWTIPELKEGETTSLTYKLSLKDTVDASILNKNLPTNKKVDIGFETADGKDDVTTEVSPKVKVNYNKSDNTVTPNKELPNTGVSSLIICSVIALIAVFAITRIIYLRNYR